MKRLIFTILFLLSLSVTANAKEYQSTYGFTIDVPDHWLVLTTTELRNNPDLFDFNNADFGAMDKNLMRQVISKIQTGNIEIYFNQRTAEPGFTDNINILKQPGRVPTSADDVRDHCSMIKPQLSQYFGREINLYQCKSVSIKKKKFFMLEFDGAAPGTRSFQYQVNTSPGISITITATSKDKTAGIIKREFQSMIKSIRFQ